MTANGDVFRPGSRWVGVSSLLFIFPEVSSEGELPAGQGWGSQPPFRAAPLFPAGGVAR
jgi:hypothetical protein